MLAEHFVIWITFPLGVSFRASRELGLARESNLRQDVFPTGSFFTKYFSKTVAYLKGSSSQPWLLIRIT